MTGQPWSPPDQISVPMGEGEYTVAGADERHRRVGTRLLDTAAAAPADRREPLTAEQVAALPARVKRITAAASTDHPGHWEWIDPTTRQRRHRSTGWPLPAVVLSRGGGPAVVLLPPEGVG